MCKPRYALMFCLSLHRFVTTLSQQTTDLLCIVTMCYLHVTGSQSQAQHLWNLLQHHMQSNQYRAGPIGRVVSLAALTSNPRQCGAPTSIAYHTFSSLSSAQMTRVSQWTASLSESTARYALNYSPSSWRHTWIWQCLTLMLFLILLR